MNKYKYAFNKAKEVFFDQGKPFKYSVNDHQIKCNQCENQQFILEEMRGIMQLSHMYLLVCTNCSFIMPFGNEPKIIKEES